MKLFTGNCVYILFDFFYYLYPSIPRIVITLYLNGIFPITHFSCSKQSLFNNFFFIMSDKKLIPFKFPRNTEETDNPKYVFLLIKKILFFEQSTFSLMRKIERL